MSMQAQPIFLLDAGFNADTRHYISTSDTSPICTDGRVVEAVYPLVGDLARICFDLDSPPDEESIEYLFYKNEKQGNHVPLQRLIKQLQFADYTLLPLLRYNPRNPYLKFFKRFSRSQFLTFNYDSLPESFLLAQNTWYPHDGYGVPVAATTDFTATDMLEKRSAARVIHLHGALCVYASSYIVEKSSGEEFVFDPGPAANVFLPFQRSHPTLDYKTAENRIIAPVPDKTEDLTREFTKEMYHIAKQLLRFCNKLIVIGYSFNPHDRASFAPLLDAIRRGSASVMLVSPDAAETKRRMDNDFPRLGVQAFPCCFRTWVEADFPGL